MVLHLHQVDSHSSDNQSQPVQFPLDEDETIESSLAPHSSLLKYKSFDLNVDEDVFQEHQRHFESS